MKNNAIALILPFFLFYNLGSAATLTVCASGCDHTSISAAITAASSGDVIDVQDATHTESNITISLNLTIQGQGQASTTIRAAARQGAATDGIFIVNSGLTVTFQNFILQNGNALSSGSSSNTNGGGVYVLRARFGDSFGHHRLVKE